HERDDVFQQIVLEIFPPTVTAHLRRVATTARATSTASITAPTASCGWRIPAEERKIGLGWRSSKGGLLIAGDCWSDFGDPFVVTEHRHISLDVRHRLQFG